MTKQQITRMVHEDKEHLKSFTNRTEFTMWFISQIGINYALQSTIKKMHYYQEALKEIGIDLNDFEQQTSFTVSDFKNQLNGYNEKMSDSSYQANIKVEERKKNEK